MFISKWAFEFAYFFNGGLRRVRGTWGVVTGLLVPWAPPSLWALWRGVRLPAAPLQWRQWKQLGKIVRKDPEEWQPCEGRAAGLGGQGSWRAMVPGLPGHPSPPRTAPALRSPLEGKQRKGPFWPEPFRSNVKPRQGRPGGLQRDAAQVCGSHKWVYFHTAVCWSHGSRSGYDGTRLF